jgi:hypothetical protein
MAVDRNSIPELLELLLRTSNVGCKAKESKICIDLRIANADLDGPDGLYFSVGLKRVWLSLDLNGLEPVPGTRFGEPTKANEVAVKQKLSNENTVRDQAELQAAAHLNMTSPAIDAKLAAGRRATAKTTLSTTTAETTQHMRVKARANLMWEVTESAQFTQLDATYLENEVLCRAKSVAGANSKSVSLTAYAKQRDLLLNLTRNGAKFSFLSNNHAKMLKILIGKALSTSGTEYGGIITFSTSEEEVEG